MNLGGLIALLVSMSILAAVGVWSGKSSRHHEITVSNAVGLTRVSRTSIPGAVGFQWQPDSEALIVWTRKAIFRIDSPTGDATTIATVSCDEIVFDVSVSADVFITVVDGHIPEFILRRLSSGEKLSTTELTGSFNGLSLSPSGDQFAIILASRIAMEVVELPGGRVLETNSLISGPGYSSHVSYIEDGSLVWWSRDELRVQRVGSADFAAPLLMPTELALSVNRNFDIGRNGALVVAGAGNNVLLWRQGPGQPPTIIRQSEGVRYVRFSADAALLAVTTERGIRVWDVRATRQLAFIPVPKPIFASFSPDGTALAAMSSDGAVYHLIAPWIQ